MFVKGLQPLHLDCQTEVL